MSWQGPLTIFPGQRALSCSAIAYRLVVWEATEQSGRREQSVPEKIQKFSLTGVVRRKRVLSSNFVLVVLLGRIVKIMGFYMNHSEYGEERLKQSWIGLEVTIWSC